MKLLLFTVSLCLSAWLVLTDSNEFNCPPLPPLTHPAESVHELKPQDIKVAMALGDSITAGFGAMGLNKDIFKDIWEYRGISWSIGGDPNATTIPSFLKHYNPDIVGASLGSHLAEICFGAKCFPKFYIPKQDVFNAAQTGALTSNLKSVQLQYLFNQLKTNHLVNIQQDWKLMTILIGFNDLCDKCAGENVTVDQYESNLREVLEEIRLNIPRIFINIVELFNISLVYQKNKNNTYCLVVHELAPFDCQCLWTGTDEERQTMDDYAMRFNDVIRKIAKEYHAKNYSDFAVVAQPTFIKADADNVPKDFFSTLDCFHPSLKGHQAFAKYLWNNMLTPSAKKPTNIDPNAPFVCPTKDTLLYTY